ncbi:glycosyltransferase family 2 protein [Candidatus Saccharibacteria bacterium]|nr:glycosyltransferase family 2 protein [Candidatus Saccharibacteria bacterium]
MKKKVDVTFGIPCYNSGKTIIELLKCFRLSQYFNYEIIILDDGSSDNTVNLCKDFKKKSGLNVKIYSTSNNGVSSARNEIISLSSGTWLTFVDSDDLIDFGGYEKIIMDVMNCNYDFVICSKRKADSSKFLVPYLISKEVINSPCCKFYRVNQLKASGVLFPLGVDLGEDLIFNLRYIAKCRDVKMLRADIYVYRFSDSSLTNKYRENKYETLMALNDACKKIVVDEYGNDKKMLKALEYIRIKNCISCLRTHKGGNMGEYYNKLRRDNPRRFVLLNSFEETTIYAMWYLLPRSIIIKILKRI